MERLVTGFLVVLLTVGTGPRPDCRTAGKLSQGSYRRCQREQKEIRKENGKVLSGSGTFSQHVVEKAGQHNTRGKIGN